MSAFVGSDLADAFVGERFESVNQMAGNLTAQVRSIADVTIAVANGDLSKKITVDVRGEIPQLKEAINKRVDPGPSALRPYICN